MIETKKIFVDTNIWMAISELKLDLFLALESELNFPFQIAVLSGVMSELEKIHLEQAGKERRAARLALQIIEQNGKKVLMIESRKKNVDDELTELSRKGELVLTLDVLLKKRLSKPYLTIRQKKRIIIV